MLNPEQELKVEMQALKNELIQKHIDLGQKATGNWIAELEVFVERVGDTFKAKLLGAKYTKQLVQGLEPGNWVPIPNLIEWINAKPITPSGNISVESLAYAIQRKIFNVGTDYYPQGTDLIDSVITTERIKQIIEKIGVLLVRDFTLEINEDLKRVAQ